MTCPASPELDLDNLKALKILGRGAMGTVFLVQNTTTATYLALKVVDKSSVDAKPDSDRRARWETQVLSRLSHPFLPSLLGTFETDHLLGWGVPYCPGGDLNVLRHRQVDSVFSPAVIRFYVAEILCALDHLHSMGIAYRDLKPENVLIQQTGHVTLTDFDLSRNLTLPKPKTVLITDPKASNRKHDTCHHQSQKGLKKPKSARVSPVSRRRPSFSAGERSNSFVGTEEYVAPEVVRGDGHEFAVDWWALGVLTYEMLYGRTPFKGKNRKETFRNVLMKKPEFIGKQTVLTDLISRLLEKEPSRRLGSVRGADEIKDHEFFRGLKWDLLTAEVVMRPPFIPSRDDEAHFTEKLTGGGAAGGVDVRDYFQRLKAPQSPSCELHRKNVSWGEF
ncbi:serine/threonine-protein kinase UCNL-like [Arachis duranensis]|uniref:non-specific serine/threonine protein kinase n=1 Tax=Arachis duranensis TaxID=130453 RepID=A0A6P4BUY3_ARADU|nr:serine/threonine-protein kinase UCNL-like [Arachis duranensis]